MDSSRPRPGCLGWLTLLAVLLVAGATVRHARAGRLEVVWREPTGDAIRHGPLLDSAGRLLVVSDDGQVHAFEAATGYPLWQFRLRTPASCRPKLVAGRLLVGTQEGNLLALDPAAGQFLWHYQLGGAPVTDLADCGSVAVAVTEAGKLWAFDVVTGRARWQDRIDPPPTRLADEGDNLFWILSPDGSLTRRRVDGTVAWWVQLGNSPVRWLFPAVATAVLDDGALLQVAANGRAKVVGRLPSPPVVRPCPAPAGWWSATAHGGLHLAGRRVVGLPAPPASSLTLFGERLVHVGQM